MNEDWTNGDDCRKHKFRLGRAPPGHCSQVEQKRSHCGTSIGIWLLPSHPLGLSQLKTIRLNAVKTQVPCASCWVESQGGVTSHHGATSAVSRDKPSWGQSLTSWPAKSYLFLGVMSPHSSLRTNEPQGATWHWWNVRKGVLLQLRLYAKSLGYQQFFSCVKL